MGGGGGGTQSNKVHKFALNDVSVSTVLSKIVVVPAWKDAFLKKKLRWISIRARYNIRVIRAH